MLEPLASQSYQDGMEFRVESIPLPSPTTGFLCFWIPSFFFNIINTFVREQTVGMNYLMKFSSLFYFKFIKVRRLQTHMEH